MSEHKLSGHTTHVDSITLDALMADQQPEARAALAEIQIPREYPADAVIFKQSKNPAGVFVVRSGMVELSIASASTHLVLQIVGPGTVIGLSTAVCGRTHETTARALVDCDVMFIPRAELMMLLEKYPRLWVEVAKLLGEQLGIVFRQIRSLQQPKKLPATARRNSR